MVQNLDIRLIKIVVIINMMVGDNRKITIFLFHIYKIFLVFSWCFV